MDRPSYLSKYLFDWDMFEVVTNGQSALDAKYFLGTLETKDEIVNFLRGYGIDYNDPVNRAELFGNFQEALQFIKRYFLKEGNPEGLDLKIPNPIYMVTDIIELFVMATRRGAGETREERLWAELILKVIHTIIHVDKDLRAGYFSAVQTQVFDRFYKHLQREEAGQLFLGPKGATDSIPLHDFQTKSKKTRESVLIKLLHKPENVAEELFDRVGMRIVTYNKLDVIRVIQFLIKKSIVTPHNIKPSRSINRLVHIDLFRRKYNALLKLSMKSNLSETEFLLKLQELANECIPATHAPEPGKNVHTIDSYHAIQFTCRQLIKYKNPFYQEFNEIRKVAKNLKDSNPLAQKLMALDLGAVTKEITFFYPFEVQIVDIESQKKNTEGEASHQEYKKSQLNHAMHRLFKKLLAYKTRGI
ncbi:MAG: hypothetical protein A2X86_05885 [Bdellovibrionales bacterium GWA2_49_15]|nr:MAG: hypothetical protein A2X86_05885 [Bdellovibrionales bacterium GWA2_49_15]